jgi:hypothetical protein
MKKFKTGKWYYCRSLSDYDTIYLIEVIARSAKRITYREDGQIKRAMVSDDGDGAECFRPHGRYALCAVIHADRELHPLTKETAKIAGTVLNIDYPEWGAFAFHYQGQLLTGGDYCDTIGSGSNSRVLFWFEYQHWRIVSFKEIALGKDDREWVEGRIYSGATPEEIREEAEKTGVTLMTAAAMWEHAVTFTRQAE